ncbi:aspartate racemase [Paenibacillus sp. UNCCL117]|uniref:aspartate/glutamate racemase family protein n=1 Tax=unclassified Paenibacillus TaxID=185978 RepID=UPI000883FFDA|nr:MULTISPECIES: amino acid racemase [unclassified Paenibacillus]SDE23275.1 aspartate racemase [Paenibacillus sp. cl123]SFW42659.1 aspartate racemase [Paenibacillus sp. UNCCL117]
MSRTVGVIGGMGPLATVDFMRKVIEHTPARRDQEHVHLIVDQYPQIPDRTEAILGVGPDPGPYLQESANRLQQAGADMIAIACNTAHYFIDRIEGAVSIPVVHMPGETSRHVANSGIGAVGILATDGTLRTKLYQKLLSREGVSVLIPDEGLQAEVMEGIRAVKRGDLETGERIFRKAAEALVSDGAQAVIAGCTEVPIVLRSTESIRVVNPTDILARAIVERAYAQ